MLVLDCPFCGPRAEIEFSYGGEAKLVRPRDPAAATDAEWNAFLFDRTNPRGRHTERWRHAHGCGRFFDVTRDTVTDVIETA